MFVVGLTPITASFQTRITDAKPLLALVLEIGISHTIEGIELMSYCITTKWTIVEI